MSTKGSMQGSCKESIRVLGFGGGSGFSTGAPFLEV